MFITVRWGLNYLLLCEEKSDSDMLERLHLILLPQTKIVYRKTLIVLSETHSWLCENPRDGGL